MLANKQRASYQPCIAHSLWHAENSSGHKHGGCSCKFLCECSRISGNVQFQYNFVNIIWYRPRAASLWRHWRIKRAGSNIRAGICHIVSTLNSPMNLSSFFLSTLSSSLPVPRFFSMCFARRFAREGQICIGKLCCLC